MSERSAEVRIEGYAPEEILALPAEELDELLRYDRPVVFHAGSATILAQFRVELGALVVEVAHVDGGGEGVFPVLWRLMTGLARRQPDVDRVEWIVHATRCANPNPALRRVLDRKGYTVRDLPTIGRVYFMAVDVSHSAAPRGELGERAASPPGRHPAR
jgi:hypothetical protein